MAPARMQFEMSLKPGSARQRSPDDDAPMRLLLLADLGGDRSTALATRKPVALDIDSFDRVLSRVAPRLTLDIDGQPLALSFASLEDFHPDRLFARLPVFDALRRLREEARDSTQFRRVAAALGLQPAAPTAPAVPAAEAKSAAGAATDGSRSAWRPSPAKDGSKLV